MAGWDWGGAAQGGALGTSGFAAGPVVGAITTGAGTLLGGLGVFGRGNNGVSVPTAPQIDPSVGTIGGYVPQYTSAADAEHDRLLQMLISGELQGREADAARAAIQYQQEQFAPRETGVTINPDGTRVIDATMTTADMEAQTEANSAIRAILDAYAGTDEAREARWQSGQTPWAVAQGQTDVATGAEIMNAGFNMADRTPTALDTRGIDAARSDVETAAATDQRLRLLQSPSDYDRAESMLANDRGMMGGQLQSDLGRMVGQYGQGQDQLAYMQAVQRGEAGPSLAELQGQRMLGEGIEAQMAMAKSGPSFSPEAQRQAAITGGRMQDQYRQQAMEMRAAEQMQAQQQVGALLGQQQAGAAGIGSLGLSGTSAIGQLGLTGSQGLAGMTQDQIAAAQASQGLGLQRMGAEAGIAGTQASLADTQRARDDQMRQYLTSLGLDYRRTGYDLMGQQAANDLSRTGMATGAATAQQSQALQANQFNSTMAAQNRANTLTALGTGLGNAATAYAASRAPQQQAAATPSYSSQMAGSGAPSNPQGWNQAGVPSDERTKGELREAEQQIDALLAALAATPEAEQRLRIAAGEVRSQAAPQPAAMPQRPPTARYQDPVDEEMSDTLAYLSRHEAPAWKYNQTGRAVGGKPGEHVGYTTQQLQQAGPAGQAMVQTDPRTGLQSIEPQAATTFSLAAIGEQQRQIDELQKRLEEAERRKGSAGVLQTAGGY